MDNYFNSISLFKLCISVDFSPQYLNVNIFTYMCEGLDVCMCEVLDVCKVNIFYETFLNIFT